jgi:hypothetical protein
MLCKIWGFHSGDCEERRVLRWRHHVALVRTDILRESMRRYVRPKVYCARVTSYHITEEGILRWCNWYCMFKTLNYVLFRMIYESNWSCIIYSDDETFSVVGREKYWGLYVGVCSCMLDRILASSEMRTKPIEFCKFEYSYLTARTSDSPSSSYLSLVRKFPTFHGTQRFFTVFTAAGLSTLMPPRPIFWTCEWWRPFCAQYVALQEITFYRYDAGLASSSSVRNWLTYVSLVAFC